MSFRSMSSDSPRRRPARRRPARRRTNDYPVPIRINGGPPSTISSVGSSSSSESEFISDVDDFDSDEDDGADVPFDTSSSDTFPFLTSPTLPSNDGIAGHEWEGQRRIPTEKGLNHRIVQIVSSKYLGCEDPDELSGELMRVSGRGPSLFQWLHLNPDRMNFDEFSETARALPNLTRAESDAICVFLKRVGSKYEKSMIAASDCNGWRLQPAVTSYSRDETRFPPVDGVSAGYEDYLFCCLPYYSLGEHFSSRLPEGSRSHPSLPLFESYHLSTKKQPGLKQALCNLQGTPGEHCFHLSFLWCLLVADKYILTCTQNLAAEDILGESITIQHSPSPGPLINVTSTLPPALQVIYDNRLWLFPISECNTWFKFISQFSEITVTFEDIISIRWRERTLQPSMWPRLIAQAKRSPTRIHLIRRTHPKPMVLHDDFFIPSNNEPESSSIAESTNGSFSFIQGIEEDNHSSGPQPSGMDISGNPDPSPENPPFNPRDFHALLWAAVSSGKDTQSKPSKEDDHNEQIESYVQKLHADMQNNENVRARTAYQNTPGKSFEEVKRVVADLERHNRDNLLQLGLAQVAASVFQIFLPLKWQTVMASRYWGAVIMALTAKLSDRYESDLNRLVKALGKIDTIGNQIRPQLSAGNGLDPTQTDMPREFARAWSSILLCMQYTSLQKMDSAIQEAQSCRKFLLSARKKMLKSKEVSSFSKLEAILPTGILLFMVHCLLNDVTKQYPITEVVYWEYYAGLKTAMKADPLDRSHQRKLASLIDEIRILLHHVDSQTKVLHGLRGRLAPRVDLWSNHRRSYNRDPIYASPQHTLLRQCLSRLSEKRRSFQDLSEEAEYLIENNTKSILANKDRQEAAIFILTAVTVIFLPLLTISSYLSMNVKDIRYMPNKQWVFWVAAVPLTALVMILARVWAGPSWPRATEMLPKIRSVW